MRTINQICRAGAATGLSLILAGAMWLPASAAAAGSSGSTKACPATSQHARTYSQRHWMRGRLFKEAKANEAALQKLVVKMNRAPESKKVNLEAAILTKLVAQRQEMLTQMESFHARMMHRMHEQRRMSGMNMSGHRMNSMMFGQNSGTQR